MPAIPSEHHIPHNALRVLVTGFGPFGRFKVNPSWLAVKPLNDTLIPPASDLSDSGSLSAPRPIHITALKVLTVYDAVLSTVPGFHARPPVLPEPTDDSSGPLAAPPPEGYDLVLHVGVAGPGAMRVEKIADKTGYRQPDAEGKMAPVIEGAFQQGNGLPESAEEAGERERLGRRADFRNGGAAAPVRGFGKGYEGLPETLDTALDADELVDHLKGLGFQVRPSTDAGHFLCDFIYYCSLASSVHCRNQHGESSRALFLHCPPVDAPMSTEEVTSAVRAIVVWACGQLTT